MYFDYAWICQYLAVAPSLEQAAEALNATGLETGIEANGLEIEHTVNRPDAMSHFGVARELAVKLNLGLLHPPGFEGAISPLSGWTITSCDAADCAQYAGLKINGVHAAASPGWLKQRLEAIGQTSHGLLVDLTNFLLWEYGHPSHAFDASKIQGQQIHVRFGRKGEALTTLDGRQHQAEGYLCIADASRPIAFGGVMGGENSEVDDNTTSLLFELAVFNPTAVRRTGRGCQIESDARHRFERGVDRENMDRVIRRFIHLLLQEQPGAVIEGLLDRNLQPFKRRELTLRAGRLPKILGVDLPAAEVEALLQKMDCQPQQIPGGWRVTVPGYKVDVAREIDLIEEVIRFAGLDRLISSLPKLAGTSFRPNPLRDQQACLRSVMLELGLQETCTYAFLSAKRDAQFGGDQAPVSLRNPMNDNQAVMRRSILPNMVDCVRRNRNRGLEGIAFFEMGHVFSEAGEARRLAVCAAPQSQSAQWWHQPQTHPFYVIKGIYEAVAARLGWQELRLAPGAPASFKPDEALGIYWESQCIGGLGLLTDALAQALGLDTPLAILEMDLAFLSHITRPTPQVDTLSPFPGMQIDLAFVLDKKHDFGVVKSHILTKNLPFLEELALFDVFSGKPLEKHLKSLGFRFKFRAPDRSLTSGEISATMKDVADTVKQEFGAYIRE